MVEVNLNKLAMNQIQLESQNLKQKKYWLLMTTK